MTARKPSLADLDRARAWLVENFGTLAPGADYRVESLARLLAESRGTLDELCGLQTEALLEAEWGARESIGGEGFSCCPCCEDHQLSGGHSSFGCSINRALHAAGLGTQELRDAMRKELAER